MSDYLTKLKDPRWQKKRLEVMDRDKYKCVHCGDSSKTLHVHHRYYVSGRNPWEYPSAALQTLCEDCHSSIKDSERDDNGEFVVPEWEAAAMGIFEFAGGDDGVFDLWVEVGMASKRTGISPGELISQFKKQLAKM